jgi:hypothetical protein
VNYKGFEWAGYVVRMGESFAANTQFYGKACRSTATYMYDKDLGG